MKLKSKIVNPLKTINENDMFRKSVVWKIVKLIKRYKKITEDHV